MKRILIALSVVALFATTAHAVTRWSPNPSTFSPIRIVLQWIIGNQRIALVTSDSCQNGHKVFTVTSVYLNHFTRQITVQVDSVVTGQPCQ